MAHSEAAIDRYDGARDISCPREEQRRTRNILGLPEACNRDAFLISLDDLLVQGRGVITLAVIFRPPSSRAMLRAIPISADLEAA